MILRVLFFRNYIHDYRLYGDSLNYYNMSHQWVDHGIYGYDFGQVSGTPNAFVPPGFPVYLALIYKLFHDPYLQITIARIGQMAMSGIMVPLLSFLLVKKLLKKDSIALLTALFTALYPTYIMAPMRILTEVLSLTTMLLYFYILVLALEKRKLWINLLAGIAFGLHILVRPAMLPLLPIPFLFVFFMGYKKQPVLLAKLGAYHVLGFVVVMLPWWIRNYVVLHQVVLTATSSGNPLLAGSYPYMKDVFGDTTPAIMKNADTQQAYAKERILRGFTTQPLVYLKWYTVGKIQFMFQKSWMWDLDTTKQTVHILFHNFFIWVGSAGILINSWRSKIHRAINLYALMFLGIYLVFIPESRYTFQHMFFVMLAAAALIVYIIESLIYFLNKQGRPTAQ